MKTLAAAAVILSLSVGAMAQKRKPKQEPVPYPPPFETSEPATMTTPDKPPPSGSVTWEADTRADAGITGVGDATLRDLIERPEKLLDGKTYIVEGVRVGSIALDDDFDLYLVALTDARTGASTLAYLDKTPDGLTFATNSPRLREALAEQPDLRRVPARVRFQWKRFTHLSWVVSVALIYSVEFIDKNGQVAKVVR